MGYWKTDDYHISEHDWLDFLKNRNVFSGNHIAVMDYIYNMPNHRAAATEIGKQLGHNYWTINTRNRELSRRVLQEIGKEPHIKARKEASIPRQLH